MKISVIIPARNEARNISACIQSFRHQIEPPDEIIVVDDNSEDNTCELAKIAGATVLHSYIFDGTHQGKPTACAYGAALARGELLIFADADVRAGISLTAQVAYEHGRNVKPAIKFWWPRQIADRPLLHRLIAPFIALWTWAEGKRPVALGQIMSTHGNDYRRLSPHGEVSREIVDDVAIATRFPDEVTNLDASGFATCAMFQSNREAFSGYLRMLAPAFSPADRPWWDLFVMLGLHLFLVTLNPWVWKKRIELARTLHHSPLSAYIHPLSHLLFLGLVVLSWGAYHIRGWVTWKGRKLTN